MNENPKCIYCNSENTLSEEHSLPMLLGEFKGFAYILKDIVCKDCNKTIGKCEEQLGRSGPESFFRQYLNIQGNSKHQKVNPFLRGSAGAKAIDFIALLPGENIEILWEFNPNERTVTEVRQIVFIDEDGKSYPVRITDKMKDSSELRETIIELGLRGRTLSTRVFARDEEKSWIEGLVSNLGSSFEWLPPQSPDQISNAKITCSVTDLYFRAMAKAGFHYFLSAVKYFNGSEILFEQIRRFIMEGGISENFVTQTTDPIFNLPPNRYPDKWGHVVVAEQTKDMIRVRIQFFLGPEYKPHTNIVRLADTSIFLEGIMPRGHHFWYYETGPVGKYYGEVYEL